MEKVIKYKTKDTRFFDSESEAIEHEQFLDDLEAANSLVQNGANILDCLLRAYRSKIYMFDAMNLDCRDKVILIKCTKDTGLIIRHWQCSKKPGYTVQRIQESGYLLVGGDAVSCSGPYYSEISVNDYLRYYKDTYGDV